MKPVNKPATAVPDESLDEVLSLVERSRVAFGKRLEKNIDYIELCGIETLGVFAKTANTYVTLALAEQSLRDRKAGFRPK